MSSNAEAALLIDCPLCRAAGHSRFYQTVVGTELRWSISTTCPSLGHQEEDGTGGGPADLRNALLEAGGTWSIRVDSPEKMRTVQILKRVLNLTNNEVSAYLTSFPVLSVGTSAEAEWLKGILAKEGIDSENWGVRFSLANLTDVEIIDTERAGALLADAQIDPSSVTEVRHFCDGSMLVVIARDDEMWLRRFEFDPERTKLLAAAFVAVGIPVQRELA